MPDSDFRVEGCVQISPRPHSGDDTGAQVCVRDAKGREGHSACAPFGLDREATARSKGRRYLRTEHVRRCRQIAAHVVRPRFRRAKHIAHGSGFHCLTLPDAQSGDGTLRDSRCALIDGIARVVQAVRFSGWVGGPRTEPALLLAQPSHGELGKVSGHARLKFSTIGAGPSGTEVPSQGLLACPRVAGDLRPALFAMLPIEPRSVWPERHLPLLCRGRKYGLFDAL